MPVVGHALRGLWAEARCLGNQVVLVSSPGDIAVNSVQSVSPPVLKHGGKKGEKEFRV